MFGARAHKKDAETVRKFLARWKLTDNKYRIIRSGKFIYFPLRPGAERIMGKKLMGRVDFVDIKPERQDQRLDYKDMLEKALGNDYASATRGYDIVGDIAIIEAKNMRTARKMAKIVMKLNSNVVTVLAKGGPVSGKYRIRSYKWVAGKRKYETLYKENGASFIVDVRKAFFSPRLAYERERINKLVGKKENVMVMFAGVGPFAIEIARRHKDAKVVAIELNRRAWKYMLRNIELNRVHNVDAQVGDVKKVVAKYAGSADRIIMPLPKESYAFLDSVVKAAKKRSTVHYYAFGERDSAYEDNVKRLNDFFRGKAKLKVLSKRIVRPYSPREVEVAIDFALQK